MHRPRKEVVVDILAGSDLGIAHVAIHRNLGWLGVFVALTAGDVGELQVKGDSGDDLVGDDFGDELLDVYRVKLGNVRDGCNIVDGVVNNDRMDGQSDREGPSGWAVDCRASFPGELYGLGTPESPPYILHDIIISQVRIAEQLVDRLFLGKLGRLVAGRKLALVPFGDAGVSCVERFLVVKQELVHLCAAGLLEGIGQGVALGVGVLFADLLLQSVHGCLQLGVGRFHLPLGGEVQHPCSVLSGTSCRFGLDEMA